MKTSDMAARLALDLLEEDLILEEGGGEVDEVAAIEAEEEELPSPAEFQSARSKVMTKCMDIGKTVALLKAELKPVSELAKKCAANPNFYSILQDVDRKLDVLSSRCMNANSYLVNPDDVDVTLGPLDEVSNDLTGLLTSAKNAAKSFGQGYAKVRSWDKKEPGKREDAPYEVKVAVIRRKEASAWDLLKKVLPTYEELTAEGSGWVQALFRTLYSNFFESMNRRLDTCMAKMGAVQPSNEV